MIKVVPWDAKKHWHTAEEGNDIFVIPCGDEVLHELSDSCICGPSSEFRATEEGGKWLVVHSSLDGRERLERAIVAYAESGGKVVLLDTRLIRAVGALVGATTAWVGYKSYLVIRGLR